MLENPGRVAVLVLDKFHLVLEHVSILVHNLFHRSNTSKSEFKIAQIVQTYCRIIIRPHRINLPSPRFQWRKYEREKSKINANRGALRADLLYGDRLQLSNLDFWIRINNEFRQVEFIPRSVLWSTTIDGIKLFERIFGSSKPILRSGH